MIDLLMFECGAAGLVCVALRPPGAARCLRVCGIIEVIGGICGVCGLAVRHYLQFLSHTDYLTWELSSPHLELIAFGALLLMHGIEPRLESLRLRDALRRRVTSSSSKRFGARS
ncbi:MAG: hypothetical protein KDC95_23215 [Planctomycetes bacterium]|nr:hypothetical protein [Planctomycetota bacterium]